MTDGSSRVSRPLPLVVTKLRPPTNKAHLVVRSRLVKMLGRSMSRHLTFVHAPAGFGKTTLMAQWRDQLVAERVTVGWLAIDALDNNLVRFLTYVLEALRSVDPDIGPGLLDKLELSPGTSVDIVIDELINELELYDNEVALFLDDWHLIKDPAIHGAMERLLVRAPPNFHTFVISRNRVGLPLARLRVQDELVEINASDMRFDLDESITFLSEAKALELDDEQLQALWRSTEGWAAALQLASISLRNEDDRDRIFDWMRGAPRDIGEYLAEDVLTSLAPEMVRFMLRTSILRQLSGDLCRAVTGEPASQQFLDAMERQELFLLPIDEDRQWFRYHHLFAKFLQLKLDSEYSSEVVTLHLRASEWFSAHGMTAEALDHALAAGDSERAADIVERDAMTLVQSSYNSTLLGLVSKLQPGSWAERPVLQTAVAWANALTHRPQEAAEALSRLTRIGEKASAAARRLLLVEANVIRGCMDGYADRIDDLAVLVKPCLDECGAYSPWVVGVAANILAYRHLYTHKFEEVMRLMTWARDYQDRALGSFSVVYGRCFSGRAALLAGDVLQARRFFQDAVNIATAAAGAQSCATRLGAAMLGQALYESNQLDDVERLLQDNRALDTEGTTDFYLATFVTLIRLKLQKGRYKEASMLLAEGQEKADLLRLDRMGMAITMEKIRFDLLIGDFRSAERIFADAEARFGRRVANATGTQALTLELLQMARARLLMEQGEAVQAVELLAQLVDKLRASGRRYQELCLEAQLAIALDLAGRPQEAESRLAHAVAEGIPRGIVRSFLDEGPRVVTVLERLRERERRGRGVPSGVVEFGESANQLLLMSRNSERGLPRLDESWLSAARAGEGERRYAALSDELKQREIDILRFLDQGRSNKEIARLLGIGVDTVKWYLKSVFMKLGVNRRGEAIAVARSRRLLDST